MALRIDPAFMEEAVWLALRQPAGAAAAALGKSFQAEREALYAGACAAAARETAFQRLTAAYFERLGLQALFQEWLQEMPLLSGLDTIVVQRVWSRKEERAELYLRESASSRELASALMLGLQAARCQEPSALRAWLRHEGMRASDMLEAAFAYTPQPILGGHSELEQDLIRERFHLLWERWIMVRMQRRGWGLAAAASSWERQFSRAFGAWPADERAQIIQRLQEAPGCTQATLLALAQDARGRQTLGAGGLLCPLCHFPTAQGVGDWSGRMAAALSQLRREYPWWDVSQGACRQCADMAAAQAAAA